MNRLIPKLLISIAIICTIPVGIKLFYFNSLEMIWAVALHLISAISCTFGIYFYTYESRREGETENLWWIYSLTLCLLLPVYGILLSLVIFGLQERVKKRPPPIISDEIVIQAPEVFLKKSTKSKQIEILERLDIEPFIDILYDGPTELKRSVIKQLGGIKNKKAVETLTYALRDKDIEVRLYAAGILGALEDEHTKKIKEKKAVYDRSKAVSEEALAYLEEGEISSQEAGIKLIKSYIDFIESGLLDDRSKEYYYDESLKVIDSLEQTETVKYLRAKTYFSLDNYDECLRLVEDLVKQKTTDTKVYELWCETLFAQHKYKELSEDIQLNKDLIVGLEPGVVNFWTQNNETNR